MIQIIVAPPTIVGPFPQRCSLWTCEPILRVPRSWLRFLRPGDGRGTQDVPLCNLGRVGSSEYFGADTVLGPIHVISGASETPSLSPNLSQQSQSRLRALQQSSNSRVDLPSEECAGGHNDAKVSMGKGSPSQGSAGVPTHRNNGRSSRDVDDKKPDVLKLRNNPSIGDHTPMPCIHTRSCPHSYV